MDTKSSLTFKRIFITSLLYLSTPFSARLVNTLIQNETISYTLIISIVGFINITYNWDLFALHYNRSKKAVGDTLFFTLVGLALIGLITFININYLYGYILLANKDTVLRYFGGALLVLIVYSFIFSFNTLITFKCVLDRIKISNTSFQLIIFSGLMFGLIFSLFYIPLNINIQVSSFLYYSIIFMICSYLYNQTRTIIPSLISLSLVLLIVNILNIYF